LRLQISRDAAAAQANYNAIMAENARVEALRVAAQQLVDAENQRIAAANEQARLADEAWNAQLNDMSWDN